MVKQTCEDIAALILELGGIGDREIFERLENGEAGRFYDDSLLYLNSTFPRDSHRVRIVGYEPVGGLA